MNWASKSKFKGMKGEILVAADLTRRGYKILLPWGEGERYDLVLYRDDSGTDFERVQVKYVSLRDGVMDVPCRSNNESYTSKDFEWIGVYCPELDTFYYIPSKYLDTHGGTITLRIDETKNNQEKGILWAKDFCNI